MTIIDEMIKKIYCDGLAENQNRFETNKQKLMEMIVLPKRFPREGDSEGELMCAGFNQYREIVLALFEELEKEKQG